MVGSIVQAAFYTLGMLVFLGLAAHLFRKKGAETGTEARVQQILSFAFLVLGEGAAGKAVSRLQSVVPVSVYVMLSGALAVALVATMVFFTVRMASSKAMR